MSATINPPSTRAKPRAVLRKYFNIFRASLVERLAYRLDFILSTFLRFLPVLTTILLWQAVYDSAGEDSEFRGYTLADMIAYLLLVHISRMFSSMPGLAGGIARDIRDGNLKKYLLQPIEMLPYLLSYRIAHKAAYIATSALPYAVLFGLCYQYFTLPREPLIWLAYFISLILGFVIGFYFESSIGMVGFWFLEVTSFLYVIGTITFFLSGHMFPLDILPGPVAQVLKVLPFNYLAFFPATVFLGRITGWDLVIALVIQAAWALLFVVAAHVLYRLGLRRYSATEGKEMTGALRYARLWWALARFGLIRELAFRANFLVKVSVEILWLGIMLIFYNAVLSHTGSGQVAGWSRGEYLFFVGCYFTLEGFIETLFMSNCGEFADLVRSGDLDFVLLKPIDEQFMLSLRNVEWTTVPNIFMGVGVLSYALWLQDWQFDAGQLLLFALLFACSLGLAYSFLLFLTASAVWMVRNQSLYELWWLFTTLWRNPREIFERSWAMWIGRFFTYFLPVMVIVNVPVGAVVTRVFDPYLTVFLVFATIVMLWGSRRVFRFSLQKYRSASS